jgi:hypothetical protein
LAQGQRPNEPFYWHRIVNVGWRVGGLVAIEVEFLQGVSGFFLQVTQPIDIIVLTSGLTSIVPADYRDDPQWYANRVSEPFVIEEHVVIEDPIDNIWVWDRFLINALGDDSNLAASISLFGPFDLHYEGMQVAYDTSHFGRPLLGDYVQYTHPNGHTVTFARGATPLSEAFIQWQAPPESGGSLYTGIVIRSSDPNGIPPIVDLSNTESWYWYHIASTEGDDVIRVRQAFLVYFADDRTQQVSLSNFANVLAANTVKYTMRGYPVGTSFTSSEGHIMPDPTTIVPTWEKTATIPAETDVTIVFNASGVVS